MKKFISALLFIFMFSGLAMAQDEEQTPYEIALQRIEEARVTGATELNLSNIGLEELPPEIGNLSELEVLYLGGNLLTELPSELWQLTQLNTLVIAGNQLTDLSSEIENLTSLSFLNFDGNQLASVPAEIGNFSQLETLSGNYNNLTTLPPEIGKLNNLRVLTLYSNSIEYLPPEFGNLHNLIYVMLDDNELSELPHEFGNLINLCYLGLSNNNLQTLPETFGNLATIYKTSRTEILCQRQSGINISGNPLSLLPPELVEEGAPAILEYLRNEAWWHFQGLLLGGLSFAGILAGVVLGLRWKNRRGKTKQKNDWMA